EAVIAEAMTLWPLTPTDAPELLSGTDTAHFTEHVLDDLAALDHVEVEVTGTRHAYRELDGAPQVRITQQASPGKNDWFDLGFEITIEGRQIPFPSLFVALAQGRAKLLMPDRTYFSLDHPAFDALRELIREGEALAEWEPERQRISRFQVDMWDDLQEVADETIASREWKPGRECSPRSAVVTWENLLDVADEPITRRGWTRTARSRRWLQAAPFPRIPETLRAELRPYQRVWCAWLTFLFSRRLGGLL